MRRWVHVTSAEGADVTERYGALRRFAVSNAHALLLVFGSGSALGLLSWRGAGAAADAWLASARHGRGQDVGGVCIGVLRALFALPQARPVPLTPGAAERGRMLHCSCCGALSYGIECPLGFRPASRECSGHSATVLCPQHGSTCCLTHQLPCTYAAWALRVSPAQHPPPRREGSTACTTARGRWWQRRRFAASACTWRATARAARWRPPLRRCCTPGRTRRRSSRRRAPAYACRCPGFQIW